jgi:hypothetical protein
MIVQEDYWNMRAYSDGCSGGIWCVAARKTQKIAAPRRRERWR